MSDNNSADSCGAGSRFSPQVPVLAGVEGVYGDLFLEPKVVGEVEEMESSRKAKSSDEQLLQDTSSLSLSLSSERTGSRSSDSCSSSSANSCATISSLFEEERTWGSNQNRHEKEEGRLWDASDPMPPLAHVAALSRSNSDVQIGSERSRKTVVEHRVAVGKHALVYEFDDDSQSFCSPPRESPTMLGPRISDYEEELAEYSKTAQRHVVASASSPRAVGRELNEVVATDFWNTPSSCSTLYVCDGVSPLPSLNAWRLGMTKTNPRSSPIAVTPLQLQEDRAPGEVSECNVTTSYRKALLFPSYPPDYASTHLLLSFDQGATASTGTCYEPELSSSTSSVNVSEAVRYVLDFSHFHENRISQQRMYSGQDDLSCSTPYDWNNLYRVYVSPSVSEEFQSPLALMSTSVLGRAEELHCDPYTFGINAVIHAEELGFGEQPSIKLIEDLASVGAYGFSEEDTGDFPWMYGDIGNVSWSQLSPIMVPRPPLVFSPLSPYGKERLQPQRPNQGAPTAVGSLPDSRDKSSTLLADSSDFLRSLSHTTSPSQTRLKVLSLTVETMAVAAATIRSSVAAQAKLYMRASGSDTTTTATTTAFSASQSLLPRKQEHSLQDVTPKSGAEGPSLPGSHPQTTERSRSLGGKLERIRQDVLGIPALHPQSGSPMRSGRDSQKEAVHFLFRDYLDMGNEANPATETLSLSPSRESAKGPTLQSTREAVAAAMPAVAVAVTRGPCSSAHSTEHPEVKEVKKNVGTTMRYSEDGSRRRKQDTSVMSTPRVFSSTSKRQQGAAQHSGSAPSIATPVERPMPAPVAAAEAATSFVERADVKDSGGAEEDESGLMYEYWSGNWGEEEKHQQSVAPFPTLSVPDQPLLVPNNLLPPRTLNSITTTRNQTAGVSQALLNPPAAGMPSQEGTLGCEPTSSGHAQEDRISDELEEYLQCVQQDQTHRIAEARRIASGAAERMSRISTLDARPVAEHVPGFTQVLERRIPDIQISGVRAMVELAGNRQLEPSTSAARSGRENTSARVSQDPKNSLPMVSGAHQRLPQKPVHCDTHTEELSERNSGALPPAAHPCGTAAPTTTTPVVHSSFGTGNNSFSRRNKSRLHGEASERSGLEPSLPAARKRECETSSSCVRSVMVMVTRQAGTGTRLLPDAGVSVSTDAANEVNGVVRITAHHATAQSHAFVADEFVEYNIDAKNSNQFKSAQVLALRENFVSGCNAALLLGGTSSADVFSWIAVKEIVDGTFAVLNRRCSMAVAMYTVRGGLVEDLFSSDSRLETLSSITAPVFGHIVRNVSYRNVASSKEFSALLGTVLAKVSEVRSHNQGIVFLSLVLSQPDAQDDIKVSSLLVSHAGSSPNMYKGILAKNPYEPLELFAAALGGPCHTVCLFTYSLNDLGITTLMETQGEMRQVRNSPCEPHRLMRAAATARKDADSDDAHTRAAHRAVKSWLEGAAAYAAQLSRKNMTPSVAVILGRLNEHLNAEGVPNGRRALPTLKLAERNITSAAVTAAANTLGPHPNARCSSSARASTDCSSPLVAADSVQHRDESCLTNSSAVPSQSVSCAMESSSLQRDEGFSATKMFDERLGLTPPPFSTPPPSAHSSPPSLRTSETRVTRESATSTSMTQTPKRVDHVIRQRKQAENRTSQSEAQTILRLAAARSQRDDSPTAKGKEESSVGAAAKQDSAPRSSEWRLANSRESSEVTKTDCASASTRSGPPTSTSSVAGNLRAPAYANRNNSWKGRVARLALMQEKHVEATKLARRHHGKPTPPHSSHSDTTTAPPSENYVISPTTSGSLPYTPAMTEKTHISSEASVHVRAIHEEQSATAQLNSSMEHEGSTTLLTASNASTLFTESTTSTALGQSLSTPQCVSNSTRYTGLEKFPTSKIQFISLSNEGSVSSTSPTHARVPSAVVASAKAAEQHTSRGEGETRSSTLTRTSRGSRDDRQPKTVFSSIEGGNANAVPRPTHEGQECMRHGGPRAAALSSATKPQAPPGIDENRECSEDGRPVTNVLLVDSSSETSGHTSIGHPLGVAATQSKRVRTLVIADPSLRDQGRMNWDQKAVMIRERRDGSVASFPIDEVVEQPDGSEEIACDTLNMLFDVIMGGCNASILASDTRGSAMSAVALKGIVQRILEAAPEARPSSSHENENENARPPASGRDTASGVGNYLTASIAQANGQMVTDLLVQHKYPQKLNVCVSPVCGTYIRDISERPVQNVVAFDTMLTAALSHAGTQVGSYSVGMVVVILILRIRRKNMDVSVSNLTVSFAGEFAGQYTALLDNRLVVPRPLFHYSLRGPCFTVSLVGISGDARRAAEMLECQQQMRSVVKPPVQPVKLMSLVKHLTEKIYRMSEADAAGNAHHDATGTALDEAQVPFNLEQLRHILKEAMTVLGDIRSPLPLMVSDESAAGQRAPNAAMEPSTAGSPEVSVTIDVGENRERTAPIKSVVAVEVRAGGNGTVAARDNTVLLERDGAVIGIPVDEAVVRMRGDVIQLPVSLHDLVRTFVSGCNAALLAADGYGCAASLSYFQALAAAVMREVEIIRASPVAAHGLHDECVVPTRHANLYMSIALVQDDVVVDLIKPKEVYSRYEVARSPLFGRCLQGVKFETIHDATHLCEVYKAALSLAEPAFSQNDPGMFVLEFVLTQTTNSQVSDVLVSSLLATTVFDKPEGYTKIVRRVEGEPHQLFETALNGPCMTTSLFSMTDMESDASRLLRVQAELAALRSLKPTKCSIAELMEKCSTTIVDLSEERPRAVERKRTEEIDSMLQQMRSMMVQCEEMLRSPCSATFSSGL